MGRPRLDAVLAHAGLGSRSQMRQLVASGRISVDGTVVRDGSQHIDEASAVRCDGQLVATRPLALLMHKPVGYASSHDPHEEPLLYELVPPHLRRRKLGSAGRLDRATSGLIVLTDDGQLAHRLAHPRHAPGKRYRIGYTGNLVPDAVARCTAGLDLADGLPPTRPAALTLDGPGRATLILHEGRFHQVRRMIGVLGGEVVDLHRDRIGDLDLPADLPVGAVREATPEELTALFAPHAEATSSSTL